METTRICDGEFEIVKITADLYDEAIELYKNYFMKYENVSIATNLAGTKQSTDEMLLLIQDILTDQVSFAARHCQSQQLVAMSCNKLLNPSVDSTLEETFANFTSPGMHCVDKFLGKMETTYNIYENWNIDCAFEIVFLSTRTDFGGRGLATKLSSYSIDYARQLKDRTLPAKEMESLPIRVQALQPKAVTSVFTSYFTQRLGEKLGFETLYKTSYENFEFGGKTFNHYLDPIHQYCTYAALRL